MAVGPSVSCTSTTACVPALPEDSQRAGAAKHRPERLPPAIRAGAALQPPPAATPRSRRLLKTLRVLLPAVAALLVAGAIFWPELFPTGSRVGVDIAVIETEKGDEEAMVQAVYSGVDSEGRPFSLTAERVHSDPAQPQLLQLRSPDGQIEMKDGTSLRVEAREGIYDRKQDLLDLAGDVTLHHGDDVTARTERARIDLNTSTATGDAPVTGTASFGTIDGIGFRTAQQGDVIIVGGPAHMIIHSKAEPRLP